MSKDRVRFKKLMDAIKAIKVGVEASPADVQRMIRLCTQEKLEALANALIKKTRVPKAPIHYIMKAFIFDLGIGDMQAPCGSKPHDTQYKNIFYKTYEVQEMLKMNGIMKIMPTILDEVYYFNNKIQAERYLTWAEKHRPAIVDNVRKNYITGVMALKKHIYYILNKYVEGTVKGIKLFRKATYNVEGSMRMITGQLLRGYCSYDKVKQAKKFTKVVLNKVRRAKVKPTKTVPEPLLTAEAIQALPSLTATSVKTTLNATSVN